VTINKPHVAKTQGMTLWFDNRITVQQGPSKRFGSVITPKFLTRLVDKRR
jgi:hypothetical protein